MTEHAITMRGVNKWYGAFQALRDIDLTVAPGERIVICGPSGSGKSTLIRCINQLEPIQKGKIVVDGIALCRQRERRRDPQGRRHGVPAVQPVSASDGAGELHAGADEDPQVSRAEAEETARKFLARVRIPEQADKYPAQLSGGQQQRVAIARALCMKPRIMLFDEPTSRARPRDGQGGARHHDRPRREGMTMLCVTHEMGFARAVADRVIFMDQGEIVEEGAPDTFFENPKNERLRNFLGQIA